MIFEHIKMSREDWKIGSECVYRRARSSGGQIMEFNEEECWRIRPKILLEVIILFSFLVLFIFES